MAVSLAEIDQLLNDWQRKMQSVSQNLIDLQSLPVFQTLSTPGLSLVGPTGQQVQQSIDAVNDLFHHYTLLSDFFDRATALRQRINPVFLSETKIQEIYNLFTLPSITLRHTPLSLDQRNLLSAAERVETLTPGALLDQMTTTFTSAKDVILSVDRAWSNLEPQIATAQVQINHLRRQAQQLSLAEPTLLTQAEIQLHNLRDRVLCDPLGSQLNIDRDIQPLLQSVAQTLTQLSQQKAQLAQQFIQAQQSLQQLQTQNAKIQTLYEECQTKVQQVTPQLLPPLSADTIAALASWLDRLTSSCSAGNVQPISIGLNNWLSQAQHLLQQQAQAIATNQAPLNQRNELRGRLDALQAKAKAKGQAEDLQLTTWANQARELLYSRPSPLSEAIALVTAYERRLNRPQV